MRKDVDIRPGCLRDATFVVANMRDLDRLELGCQVQEGTRDLDLAYFLLMGGDNWVAYHKDRPVMFFGTAPMNAACLSVWAVGTPRTYRVLHEVTRFIIGKHLPDRIANGYHTMEARSIDSHRQAHDWMASTGAVVVGEPFVYGREREKFLLFRWTADGIAEAAKRYGVPDA